MKLRNPFTQEVRMLFFETRNCCFLCGGNESPELHHIKGRESRSAFNGAVLCKECHAGVLHTEEEHRELLNKTAIWIWHNVHKHGYVLKDYDVAFLEENKHFY